MCFFAEADWTASVVDETTPVAEKPVRCNECGRTIPAGEMYHHIYQQEAEECLACENGDCKCPPVTINGELQDGCCACDEPDLGETFDYDCCSQCHKFLEAVEAAEIEAGCRRSEARPLLTEMVDSIRDGGAREAKKYWKKAAAMHPELLCSDYLASLWRKMFAWA